MRDKKKIIEAALFIAARPMTLAELYQVVGIPKPRIKKLLKEMETEYDDHSLSVRERDNYYELHIKEEYKYHVEHLAPEKDFSKATLQTLSLISYHNPVKQSFVVETRGNRAYDHIKELSSRGFIRLEPEGHTNRIHITKKFLDYFDLTSSRELKEYFSQRGIEPPDEKAHEENAAKHELSNPKDNPQQQEPTTISPAQEEPEESKKQEPCETQEDKESPKQEQEKQEDSEVSKHKEPQDYEAQKDKEPHVPQKEKHENPDLKQTKDSAEKQKTEKTPSIQPEEEPPEPKKEEKQKKKTKKSVNIKDEPYQSPFADVMKDNDE
ncbi:MAG: hypothetical protein DRN71_04510 [Candidatus Nanohalarchaeota archaeon]|nr:MAG: hypothetical protein DRN71_04510 [Candidatus Nanohaloarchaeota archaeon]